jgi:DNA mismatch repair ATPase MutS
MLCLIDEIFKGTNSADRIVGAARVIEKLSDDYSMTLVSTHDFELCDIKDHRGREAVNYHFEEYYENDRLKFDYKKKAGRCTTTNAMFILHMAGLD